MGRTGQTDGLQHCYALPCGRGHKAIRTVQMTEWKQTDRQTDATDCNSFPADVISRRHLCVKLFQEGSRDAAHLNR